MSTHLPQSRVEAPPTKEMICAVYVTYHPDAKFPERVARVAPQVAHIVIVDNNSNEEAVEMLGALCESGKVELIKNKENLGVATALNQGAKYAIEHGYAWALTLDQDSWPKTDLVTTLSEIYAAHPDRQKVKMLGSNYQIADTGAFALDCNGTRSTFLESEVAITSCSLMSLAAFEQVGPFRDDFFIDLVDFEYCLRLRAHDYKVIISCRPLMIHLLGNVTRHRLLWKRPICSNHPPFRRYYIMRNRIVLYRKYMFRETSWIFSNLHTAFNELVLILLFEDQKITKIKAIILGIWHAFTARMGKLEGHLT